MASSFTEDRIFSTNVEDLSINGRGKVVFTAVAALGSIKYSPRGVGGLIGSQINGHEHTCIFMSNVVNELVRLPNRGHF